MYNIEDVQIQDMGGVGEITITKDDCLLMKVRWLLGSNAKSIKCQVEIKY